MSFIKTYEKVLSPYIKEFGKAANEKVRKMVVKKAADAVSASKDLFEEKGLDLPKDLNNVGVSSLLTVFYNMKFEFQAISRYLKKKSLTEEGAAEADVVKEPKTRKIRPSYKIRDVVKQLFRDEIDSEIPYEPKDKAYISCYQKAVTKVLDNLTEEQLEEAEELLETWNKEGASKEVKLK
jgi:hypothetical protein